MAPDQQTTEFKYFDSALPVRKLGIYLKKTACFWANEIARIHLVFMFTFGMMTVPKEKRFDTYYGSREKGRKGDGKRDGEWKRYHENGDLAKIVNFIEGKFIKTEYPK